MGLVATSEGQRNADGSSLLGNIFTLVGLETFIATAVASIREYSMDRVKGHRRKVNKEALLNFIF